MKSRKRLMTLMHYPVWMMLGFLAILAGSCQKDPFVQSPPAVTTDPVTGITTTTAICGGTSRGDGTGYLERGVVWSCSTSDPALADCTSFEFIGNPNSDHFITNLEGLWPGTRYFVTAFAVNAWELKGYGNTVTFTTLPPPGETVTDIDGNIYHTIRIGAQTWMFENLRTTRYRNGDPIPLVPGAWGGLQTGAYCWLNNSPDTAKTRLGALYNWNAVTDPRNLCPAGWHVPTFDEYLALFITLGGANVAGGKMKAFGQGATNESWFTGWPGGYRNKEASGSFSETGNGFWWTATEVDPGWAWCLKLYENNRGADRIVFDKQFGCSVRCIRD